MTIIDDYLEYQEKYQSKYGELTTVLMQVGHFYEAYAVDNPNENCNGDNLKRLSDVMNIQLTRKNKSIVENSRKNPLMIGVNIWSIDKYIQILLNNNYTVVLIEQTTAPPEPDRDVTNIYSPGTNIQHNIKGDTNNLVCIYIDVHKDLKNYRDIMCVGVSSIDISTGVNNIFETYSNIDDKNLALDEIFRFIQIHDPKELVIYTKNCNMKSNELIAYLDLSHRITHIISDNEIDTKYLNINYQKTFLEKIFPNSGLLSIIEYLDLESKHFGLISYIILLDFAYQHNERIITKICKPDIWEDNKYLILTNNSINQLNVVSHGKINVSNKYDSLFGVINNTSTSIGRRLLRDRILKPIINEQVLENRYNLVEAMMQDKKYHSYETYLSKIVDIERLHRRMGLQYLQPADFASLDLAYQNIANILKSNLDHLSTLLPPNEDIENFYSFIEEYSLEFDLNQIIKYHLDKISQSFFRRGRQPIIDEKQDKIDACYDIFRKIADKLSNYIESNSNYIKLESNERDGYYLTATKKRCDVLKSRLANMNWKPFKVTFSDGTNMEINPKDINFKTVTKSNCRIEYLKITNTSHKLRSLEDSLSAICKETFLKKMDEYHFKYRGTLKKITKFVGEIDLIKSAAKTAILYGYNRPEIDMDAEHSYMDVEDIRHPIIERIQTDIEYVPNDIILGTDSSKGTLLYGTNASGKSSLMKSMGLNVIMAQAGMFVAAKKFKYKPYQYIFTRISNNDNIFKGESSFAVEMSELRCILKRSNTNSLVLGDELCSGTESVSAQSIFAASVIQLSLIGSSFIFATHLHELCNIDKIKKLKNVNVKHLKVIYDTDTQTLIYDRKLEEGSGPAIYGLEVCKAMDMDQSFLNLADQIRRNLMGVHKDILADKKSHYNAEVFVDECLVCHQKAEDVHHIKFQCSANINNMIDHIKKDVKSNLVPLCKKCHLEVHNEGLIIYGYKQTSNGIVLDFEKINHIDLMIKKKERKKFDDIQLEIIKELKKLPNITQNFACNKLKSQYNIDISKSTLGKIWNGKY